MRLHNKLIFNNKFIQLLLSHVIFRIVVLDLIVSLLEVFKVCRAFLYCSVASHLDLVIFPLGSDSLNHLIYLFNVGKNRLPKKVVKDPKLLNFISSKKVVSLVLLFLLMITSTYSLVTWLMNVFADGYVSNVDGVFFNQFFTLLILTDVIILLISFRYTEEYSKLIRNTGFIIATILIRLSFSADGFLNIILILTGVGFALLILQIFNAMENPKLDSTA